MTRGTSPLIGLHTSIAGGLTTALVQGKRLGAEVVQLFVSSPSQWRTHPVSDDSVDQFRQLARESGVLPVMVHGRYLVNLASPQADLRRRSSHTFSDELELTERLGVPYLTIHPGSSTSGSTDAGLKHVADAVRRALDRHPKWRASVLLETTSGSGSTLGGTFEELAWMLTEIDRPDRTGICLDTCHVFVAGYDIRSAVGYEQTFEQFDRIIGLDRLKAFHVNDSKGELGSRRDRHDGIGRGYIGSRAFGRLLRDRRFEGRPFILETPKGTNDEGIENDRINLAKLRRYRASR